MPTASLINVAYDKFTPPVVVPTAKSTTPQAVLVAPGRPRLDILSLPIGWVIEVLAPIDLTLEGEATPVPVLSLGALLVAEMEAQGRAAPVLALAGAVRAHTAAQAHVRLSAPAHASEEWDEAEEWGMLGL